MVGLGQAHGVRTVALITDMDTPLGRTAGNGLEVAEAVEVLRGGGPPDLIEVTLALAREMVALAGLAGGGPGPGGGRAATDPAALLADGRALAVWDAMIRAQGGDPDVPPAEAPTRHVVAAPGNGYLRRLNARAVGVAVWRLGAGRSRKEDPVSPTAGAVCLRKPGDSVTAGEPVLELHLDDESRLGGALAALEGAIAVGPEPPDPRPLVIERIA
jgi:thymidine phosphorylase